MIFMTINGSLRGISSQSSVKTLTRAILLAVGIGAILTTALLAPNAVQMFGSFFKQGRQGRRRNYERERIRQAIKALHRRQLIVYTERGNDTYIEVTDQGKKQVRRHEIDQMKLPRTEWDRRWRVILFDIPEHKKVARRAFQDHLKRLGCFLMQRSVWVYPYPCRDEIDLLSSFWDVHPNVCYLETSNLGRSEGAARKFFGLL